MWSLPWISPLTYVDISKLKISILVRIYAKILADFKVASIEARAGNSHSTL
jgi:hypothetical protein